MIWHASPSWNSTAYFCRSCGEIWARCVAGPEWQIEQSPCPSHTPSGVADWNKIPGSLINGLISRDYLGTFRWASAIESLPPALIEREFMLHLDYYEKRLLND